MHGRRLSWGWYDWKKGSEGGRGKGRREGEGGGEEEEKKEKEEK